MVDAESLRNKAEKIPEKHEDEDFSGEIQMMMHALADLLDEERQ